MADVEYDFTVTPPLAVNTLTYQIKTSSISTPLDYVSMYGSALSVFFTGTLSSGDQTTLNNLVSAASGTALPEDFVEVSSSTSTSTNSGSYITLNSMTFSQFRAGTYLVQLTGTFSTNVPLLSTPGLMISVFANGTQQTASEMSQNTTSANAPFNMTTSIKVTLSADYQTIDIRWKNNGAGNTITCTNRVLDITKVS